MDTNTIAPPSGFVLDSTPPLPEGFVLEQPNVPSQPQVSFQNETRPGGQPAQPLSVGAVLPGQILPAWRNVLYGANPAHWPDMLGNVPKFPSLVEQSITGKNTLTPQPESFDKSLIPEMFVDQVNGNPPKPEMYLDRSTGQYREAPYGLEESINPVTFEINQTPRQNPNAPHPILDTIRAIGRPLNKVASGLATPGNVMLAPLAVEGQLGNIVRALFGSGLASQVPTQAVQAYKDVVESPGQGVSFPQSLEFTIENLANAALPFAVGQYHDQAKPSGVTRADIQQPYSIGDLPLLKERPPVQPTPDNLIVPPSRQLMPPKAPNAFLAPEVGPAEVAGAPNNELNSLIAKILGQPDLPREQISPGEVLQDDSLIRQKIDTSLPSTKATPGEPLNPGGAVTSLSPELQAKSAVNNSREAFAQAEAEAKKVKEQQAGQPALKYGDKVYGGSWHGEAAAKLMQENPQLDTSKVEKGTMSSKGEFYPESKNGKMYGGFFFLDPDFWRNQVGVKEDVKTDAKMLFNRIRNKLGADSSAWKAVGDKEEFQKFMQGQKSPKEVREWLQDNGPKVEVRKFTNSKDYTPQEQAAYARKGQLQHEIETLGWRIDNSGRLAKAGSDLTYERDNPNVPKEVWIKLDEHAKVESEINQLEDKGQKESSHWSSIAPKPESDMPGYTEIAVVKPLERSPAKPTIKQLPNGRYEVTNPDARQPVGESFTYGNLRDAENYMKHWESKEVDRPQFPSSHNFPPNTLGWVRGYMDEAGGKKVFHVIELQSDWAQDVRKTKENIPFQEGQGHHATTIERLRRNLEYKDDPLLPHYERLALKAAIEHAREQGAEGVVISDAETAMLTEGHDRAAKEHEVASMGVVSQSAKQNLQTYIKEFKEKYPEPRYSVKYENNRLKVVDNDKTMISQEPGMRLHYDKTMPKILEELTGEKGERVSMGEHKMTVEEQRQTGQDTFLSKENAYKDAEAHGLSRDAVEIDDYDNNRFYWTKKVKDPRKDLIFRNPDGTPKTDITGKLYNISKAKSDWSLFGSDKATKAGEGTKFYSNPLADPDFLKSEAKRVKEAAKHFQDWLKTKRDDPRPVGWSPYFKATKEQRAKAMLDRSDAKKIEDVELLRAQPGEKNSITQRLGNVVEKVMNAASKVDKALLPRDVILDMLDGGKAKYDGPVTQNLGWAVDDAFNAELNRRKAAIEPITSAVKEAKLNKQNGERIGVYAIAQQEGGRQRLIEAGVKPEVIDRISKTLSPAEKSVYGKMRAQLDAMLPQIQSLAKELYKVDVKGITNYFPFMRDWEEVLPEAKGLAEPKKGESLDPTELMGFNKMLDDMGANPRGTKGEQGFTQARKPGSKTAIKFNAFEIYQRHVTDVAHFLEMQKLLKENGEIVRSERFKQVYGEEGQKLANDWLNTVARQGRFYRQDAFLDTLRRKTSVGIIAYRLGSQFVHLANLPLAIQRSGGVGWWKRGLEETLSEKGQEFLKRNFAETFERGGGEPALTEASRGKIANAGFYVQRQIDRINAQTSVLASYMKQLEAKGKNAASYAELPIDREALGRARVLARRAVASPLYTDTPSAIARGGPWTKLFLQFQNTFLDQWSNIRYDLAQAGIVEKNPKLVAKMAVAIAAMLVVETSIKLGTQRATMAATGYDPKKKKTFEEKLAEEALKRVPGMGQIMNMVEYGGTGIPSVDTALEVAKSGKTAYEANKEGDRKQAKLAGVKAATAALEVAGVPGTSQISELVQNKMKADMFKSHERLVSDQQNRPYGKMNVSERYKAEKAFQANRPSMTPAEKAKAGEASIRMTEKRREELVSGMSAESQEFVKDKNLSPVSYQPFIQYGPEGKTERIYMTQEEEEKFKGMLTQEYDKYFTQHREALGRMPTKLLDKQVTKNLTAIKKEVEMKLLMQIQGNVSK